MSNNKTYRIRTDINSSEPFYLNVNLNQDYNLFEILSLKIGSENFYRMYTSSYGCIAGRVLANDALGIPNAKISVFIPTEETDEIDPVLRGLYPYETILDKNEDNIRYNVLPDEAVSVCHQPVGSIPNKRLVLDDDNVLEIFDKYYKYTTVTNDAGDYMLFGIPVGTQTVHVDLDLSDIGDLSQRPIDMMYKGYDVSQFESTSMFKGGTDIDTLTQIISQDTQVEVKPFWGDETTGEVSITRNDVNIHYKFEPTCIFMGSIITDSGTVGFSKKCVPSNEMGNMDQLVGEAGTIEMIRRTPQNNVESLVIQGTRLIDGSGVWCYQIPMNLDYIGTDEYGNRVATNDVNKGVPTRTRVRFRISLNEETNAFGNLHVTKVLVPNNPSSTTAIDYAFGENTLDNEESFKDLFVNNVYTVKSYIPRIQKGNGQRSLKFSGIKNITKNNGNNQIPYNNMRVNITFMFILQCAIVKILIWIIGVLNKFYSSGFWYGLWNVLYAIRWLPSVKKELASEDQLGESGDKPVQCITLGDGMCPDMEGWYFAPNCGTTDRKFKWKSTSERKSSLKRTASGLNEDIASEPKDKESVDGQNGETNSEGVCVTAALDYLLQCVEINLAMEYGVVQFDFYNDWLNGVIYLPKWFGEIKPKKNFLFGLIKIKEKTLACMDDNVKNKRYLTQQCALTYSKNGETYNKITTPKGCTSDKRQKCHKAKGRKKIKILGKENGGVVHRVETSRMDYVHYLRPCESYYDEGKEKTVILFATDLVLLGSVNQFNRYGIPLVFGGLSHSSYKFPSLIVSTNLSEESSIYNACSNGGSSAKVSNLTTNGFVQNGEEVEDVEEYRISEFAGVDWGVQEAPGLGKDNLQHLYYPSGHFLGISCTETETNIKTCVNLSRVCEIGVNFSQYSEINSGDKTIRYSPNGIITGRELDGNDYRRIFATLNFNNLKTRESIERTLTREYDFITNLSYGFDGVLNNLTNNSSYKSGVKLYKMTSQTPSNDYTYGTSFEMLDADYVKFRFGKDTDTEKYFLMTIDESQRSFPVYRNSYYFYFGIKNGNTAYDKLVNDYYSVCTNSANSNPNIETKVLANNGICDTKVGIADVSINNLSSMYTIFLEKITNIGTLDETHCAIKLGWKSSDNKIIAVDVCDDADFHQICEGIRGANSYCINTTKGTFDVSHAYMDYGTPGIYKNFEIHNLEEAMYILHIRMLNDNVDRTSEFTIKKLTVLEDESTREYFSNIFSVNFENGIVDNAVRTEENTDVTDETEYIGGYIYVGLPSNGGNDISNINIIAINSEGNTELVCTSEGWTNGCYTKPTEWSGAVRAVMSSDKTKVTAWQFFVPSGDTSYYVRATYNCGQGDANPQVISEYYYTVEFGPLALDYYFTDELMSGRILRKTLTNTINLLSIEVSTNLGMKEWYLNPAITGITSGNTREDFEHLAMLESAIIYEQSLFDVVSNEIRIDVVPTLDENYEPTVGIAYTDSTQTTVMEGFFVKNEDNTTSPILQYIASHEDGEKMTDYYDVYPLLSSDNVLNGCLYKVSILMLPSGTAYVTATINLKDENGNNVKKFGPVTMEPDVYEYYNISFSGYPYENEDIVVNISITCKTNTTFYEVPFYYLSYPTVEHYETIENPKIDFQFMKNEGLIDDTSSVDFRGPEITKMGNKTIVINPSNSNVENIKNEDIDNNNLPFKNLLLPTTLVVTKNNKLTTDNSFENYTKKLSDLGYTFDFQDTGGAQVFSNFDVKINLK